MTRIAIIADVHADAEALRDALAQIDRLGCDGVVCAGDVVGYGLFPEETIALLRERNVTTVRGNWDRWALGDGRPDDPSAVGTPYDASGWNLSRDARRYLRGLPRVWKKTIDGVRVVVVHGSVRDEMDAVMPDVVTGGQLKKRLDEADADVLVVGHSHEPFRFAVGKSLAVNPGAIYRRPMDEAETIKVCDVRKGEFVEVTRSTGGTFGILDLPSKRLKRFVVRRAVDGAVVKIARVAKA